VSLEIESGTLHDNSRPQLGNLYLSTWVTFLPEAFKRSNREFHSNISLPQELVVEKGLAHLGSVCKMAKMMTSQESHSITGEVQLWLFKEKNQQGI